MKKSLIAVAVALISAHAFASGPTAGTVGAVGVTSGVAGQAFSGVNGGQSQSGALSLQSATVSVYANTTKNANCAPAAQSSTTSAIGSTQAQGYAFNLSSGNATGSAVMSGAAGQGAIGGGDTPQVGYPGFTGWPGNNTQPSNSYISTGTEGGAEGSGSIEKIVAGTNQGAVVAANTGGNFGADVGYNTTPNSVPTPSGQSITTPNGNTISVTAGSIGGTYANTSTAGVYADNNGNVEFGGAPGSNVLLQNSGAGLFDAGASIDGIVSDGNTGGITVPVVH